MLTKLKEILQADEWFHLPFFVTLMLKYGMVLALANTLIDIVT